MKRSHLLLLIPVMWILAGCPVSVEHPLGYPGKEKIDERLVGNWVTADTSAEIISLRITKTDDHTLHAKVLQRGSMYVEEVDDFTGWCTELNGRQFMYFQDAADPKGGYYTYCYWFDGKNLVASDFSLKVGGVDAVVSTEAYRAEVQASMGFADWLGTAFTYSKR